MDFKDPVYEKLLAAQMMVHMAASPQRLRPMIEAQIARARKAMSAALADYLRLEAGRGRKAIVVCGSGHVAYGLGTPAGSAAAWGILTIGLSCWPSVATFNSHRRKRPSPGPWRLPTSNCGRLGDRSQTTWRSLAQAGSDVLKCSLKKTRFRNGSPAKSSSGPGRSRKHDAWRGRGF